MSRRDPRKSLSRPQAVPSNVCPVGMVPGAPEARGQIGWVMRRNGRGVEKVWWLRCPWCREMVQLDPRRLFMVAGEFRIRGAVKCAHCETAFNVDKGEARRKATAHRTEGRGHASSEGTSV